MNFDLQGAREAGYSDAEIVDYLGQTMEFDVAGARKAGYADKEIVSHLLPPPPTAGDYAKSAVSGALSGAGMIAQGGGELLARGVNAVAGTELRAENPLQGAIDWLERSKSPGAQRAIEDTQITGSLFEPSTWDFGSNPTLRGLALQGLNAIGQFAPNLAVGIASAGASIPAQLAIGATVGGLQALGGGAGEERAKFEAMTPEQLAETSSLYRELIAKGVDAGVAKGAVAEAAALGGGIGNAIPSAAEGAFENFLIGAITRGRFKIPAMFGSGAAGKVATGVLGGGAIGGTEEAVEQVGQNIGANLAIGGNRPVTSDTLQQFVMGAIAEGAVGGGGAALQHALQPAEAPRATPEQRTEEAVSSIVGAGSADQAISTAMQATAEPVFESDIESSIAGQGLISGAIGRAVQDAAEPNLREPGYEAMERQRAESIAAATARAEAARRFEDGREAELTGEARAARDAEIGGLIQQAMQERAAAVIPQAEPQGAVGLALQRARLPGESQRAYRERLASLSEGTEQEAVRNSQTAYAQPQEPPAVTPAEAATPIQGSQLPESGSVAEPATNVAEKATVPTVKQRLFVERGNQRIEVESLEDAAGKWDEFFQAAVRAGPTEGGIGGARVVDQDGKEVARISQNGRIWPPGEWKPGTKPLMEAVYRTPAERGSIKDITGTTIDQAAHEAAISPQNALPEPSKEQILAGNAKLGHPKVAGMDVSVENPAGSIREDKAHTPPAWRTEMKSHYGYIRQTVGYDKDHLDTFVKPGTPENWSGTVYVVNQNKANGQLDEHKALIGFKSQAEARAAYLENYEKGWESRIRSVVPMPLKMFKDWAYDKTEKGPKGGEVKPLGTRVEAPSAPQLQAPAMPSPQAPAAQPAPATQAAEPFPEFRKWTRKQLAASIQQVKGLKRTSETQKARLAAMQAEVERRDQELADKPLSEKELKRRDSMSRIWKARAEHRKRVNAEDSLVPAIIKLGGLRSDLRKEVSGDVHNPGIPGVGFLFSKRGKNLDEMALLLVERGYLTQADIDAAGDTGGTRLLVDRLDAELKGNAKHYAGDAEEAQFERERQRAEEDDQRAREAEEEAARLGADIDLTVTPEELAADGFEPDGQSLTHVELGEKAEALEPGITERLAMQHENDADYLAALVQFLKERESGNLREAAQTDGTGETPGSREAPAAAPAEEVAPAQEVSDRQRRAEWVALGRDVAAALPHDASRFKPQPRDFAEAAKTLDVSPADAATAWRIFHDDESATPKRRSPRGLTSQADAEEAARPALSLAAQTEAELKAKQDALDAAEKKAAEEAKPTGPNVKADQVDMFNTQGGLFGHTAQPGELGAQANPIAQAADALIQAANAMKAAVAKPEQRSPAPEVGKERAAPEQRIEDVGENLWANRRNFTRGAIDWDSVKDLNDALKVKEVVKAKVWPKPDYEQLVEQGMEPFIARMLKQVYDGIAAAPAGKSDAELQRYIDVVGRVREAVFAWAKDTNANRDFLNKIAERARQSGPRSFSISVLAGDDGFKDVILDRVWPLAETEQRTRRYRFSGNEERTAEIRAIGGNRALKHLQFTMDDAVAAMKDLDKGWPKSQEQWQRQGYQVLERDKALTVREQKQPGGEAPLWVIEINGRYSTYSRETVTPESIAPGKWMVVDKRRNIVGSHDTEEAAKEAARELTKREAKGGDIRGMNIGEAERTGPERRAEGEDVTPQRLMDEFGFRGVNFGREGWINQAERQAYLNHAYDALYDLAEIVGVPPKALSLNGMLGIAFGAQGRGGHAAAHFVPGHNEINLTKTMGAGTLAHEWGHALDHYFATLAGLAKSAEPFMAEHATLGDTRPKLDERGLKVGTEPRFGDLRPEIVQAFKAVVEAMEKRPMTEAEVTAHRQIAHKRTMEQLEKWIQHFRKDVERNAPDELAKFDKQAERLRKGDRGSGLVKVGGQVLSEPVARIKGIVKNMQGQSTNIASNWKGLESNASHVAYVLEQKEAAKEHIPQTTNTQYAGESAAKDRDKGGKAYWRTRWEMFARAFETYVASRLADLSRANTFLSEAHQRAEAKDRSGGYAQPYPRGEDRERINAAMDTLVRAIETKETDKGVAMFSRETLADRIDAILRGESGRTPIYLGQTPAILQRLGMRPLPMGMAEDTADGAMFDHGMISREMKVLADAIADPVAVVNSESKIAPAGSLVVITDLVKSDGRPVIVGIHPDKTLARAQVNEVASVYPKDNAQRSVARWLEEGLRYVNNDKRPEWQRLSGVQFPRKMPTRSVRGETLLSQRDFVKEELAAKWGEDPFAGAAFAKADATGRGIPTERVRTIVSSVRKAWGNAPDVEVVESMQDPRVPEEVRATDAKQRSQGASGEPEGFFYGGKVYLVASALDTEQDAIRTLLHESLGHYGLRGTYGAGLDRVLDIVASGQRTRVAAKAEQYGLDMNDREQRRQAAEEVLAEIAQTRPESGLVKRAIAAIRQFLKDIGFDLKLSDNDVIEQFIVPARGFVERSRSEATTGATEAMAFGRTGDQANDTRQTVSSTGERSGARQGASREVGAGRPAADMSENVSVRTSSQTGTAAFRAWFKDSKVVDAKGEPLVVYHGTPTPGFSKFTRGRGMGGPLGSWFATTGEAADKFAQTRYADQGPAVYPVYLSITKPMEYHGWTEFTDHVAKMGKGDIENNIKALRRGLAQRGYDGVVIRGSTTDMGGVRDDWVAFRPEQIKSVFNRGTFDPENADIRFSRAPAIAGTATTGDVRDSFAQNAANFVRDYLTGFDKLSWWNKTVGTPFHIAMTHPTFRPFYNESQAFLYDVAKFASESHALAPDLMPTVESYKDFFKKPPKAEEVKKVSDALYAGTLWGGGSPTEGRIWTDEELRTGRATEGMAGGSLQAFAPLSEREIGLYRQSLAAINNSLDGLAKSLIHKLVSRSGIGFDREQGLADVVQTVNDRIDEALEEQNLALGAAQERGDDTADIEAEIDGLKDLKAKVADISGKTEKLKQAGYTPAMRFGQFAVYVTRPNMDGSTEQLYFGMYDTKPQAIKAAKALAAEYPDADITKGVVSKEQYKLFQGLSLDALETFVDYITDEDGKPIGRDPIVQQFLKAAVSERSALKRHLHRKGVAGYSEDLTRVLASFVTSSARATSSNYHTAEMLRAANDIGPGDIKDYAVKSARYLMDPVEEAHKIRGFLFAQYLGGSIASGLVNMTQPFMLTAPFLSQHTSVADAYAKIGKAAAENPNNLTGRIRAAYDRAKKAGIIAPQEIHQLRAETQGGAMGRNLALRKLSFAWGSLFSMAEQANRKTTFLAAYRIAEEKRLGNPYDFAVDAVQQTQFTYNKANRPAWGRGPIGATIFTFKIFSVSYLELAKRLYKTDKKAFAVMMLVLLAGAGLEGLPFAEDIEDLIDSTGQWMGFATNTKKRLRKMATDILGPDLAQVALHGVSGLPFFPVDVAGRLGMQNLIPGTAMLKPSEKNKARDVLELIGPVGQFVPVEDSVAGKAINRLLNGDLLGILKTGVATRAVANAAIGGEMMQKGYATDYKGKRITEVSPGEAGFKMMGLQPGSVAKESRKIQEVRQDIDIQRRTESEIAEQWARGIVDSDRDQVLAAQKRLYDWNTENKDLRIRVEMGQIRRRVQEMRRPRMERFIRSTPPEIRGGVREALRQ